MDPIWQWLIWFLFHRVTRYVLAWVVCLIALYLSGACAWEAFDDSRRADGNQGHTTIDFGGQWLMGAMLLHGDGPHLYHRNSQRQLLLGAFPYDDEIPDERRPGKDKGKRDAEELMTWFMGSDSRDEAETVGSVLTPLAAPDALGCVALLAAGQGEWTPEHLQTAAKPRLGGPLYPPVNALYLAPLALFRPQSAYRTNQMLCLVWALAAGLGVSYLTRGKFWWPVAATLILVYPGFKGSLHLGQNAPLTLLILIWGWALLARGHPIWGGIIWGLLAFKPVWALSFFFVPLLTGRPRFCLAMLASGAVLGLATLPFVGIQAWFDWLAVGREAAALYNTDQNWVFLSRDLLGIPRRWMLDFSVSGQQRDRVEAAVAGWSLWAVVLGSTLVVTALRWKQRRATTGPAPAFLFLAAWMLCYHFMYYDTLLSVLPFFLLLAEPRRYLEPIFVALLPLPTGRLGDDLASYYRPRLPEEYPSPLPALQAGHRHLLVLNRMVPSVLLVMLAVEHLFGPLGLGVSVTGYWSPAPHEATIRLRRNDPPPATPPYWSTKPGAPATIQWEEPTGAESAPLRTVTSTSQWPEQPIKLSSSLYADGQPWDTYVLMFLWLWCGGLWLRRAATVRERCFPLPDGRGSYHQEIFPAVRPA